MQIKISLVTEIPTEALAAIAAAQDTTPELVASRFASILAEETATELPDGSQDGIKSTAYMQVDGGPEVVLGSTGPHQWSADGERCELCYVPKDHPHALNACRMRTPPGAVRAPGTATEVNPTKRAL